MFRFLPAKLDDCERHGIGSDADMLAELTGIPGVVWGVIWIAVAVVASGWFLLVSAQKEKAA